MDLHFFEPDELPHAREDMRIESAGVTPYSDRRRVKLSVVLTPFRERPNLDIVVINPAGEAVTVLSVIEAMDRKMDLTLHLRDAAPEPHYTAHLVLFYAAPLEQRDQGAPDQVVDTRDIVFETPEAHSDAG